MDSTLLETDWRHFDAECIDGISVLRLGDTQLLNFLLVNELQNELLAYVGQERPMRLIVHFGQVTHSFTAVINALLLAKKRLARFGGDMRLCSLQDTVREAYRMLNLEGTVFDIFDTLDEALAGWTE